MSSKANSILFAAIGVTCTILMPISAAAESPCTKNTIQDEMAKLLEALNGPKAQTALAAAKADWDEDQDLDNEENAKYMKAAALWHDITRNANGEDVSWACERMTANQTFIEEIIGAQ